MRLLDLFCGAGGAAMGYHRAGFEVVGVDIKPQPRYPFEFHQADALEYCAAHGAEFDVIHASPPCQRYSSMSNCRHGLALCYQDLIAAVRERLQMLDRKFVIENVPGAPLRKDLVLCGTMFGLALYRHRVFESNARLSALPHPVHAIPSSKAGHWRTGTIISVAGHFAPISIAEQAMGIGWMTRDELGEAIPPAYAEFIGRQLLEVL